MENPFEVLWEPGRGSTGVVYRAGQRGFDREVASRMVEPGAAGQTYIAVNPGAQV